MTTQDDSSDELTGLFNKKVIETILFPNPFMDLLNSDAHIDQTTPAILTTDTCVHEWKEYVGLSECYQFCTKCDEKNKS